MRREIFIASFGWLLLSTIVFSTAAFAGSITGKITYDGSVPKLRPIKMDADPSCVQKHRSPVYPQSLVLGDGNGLGNVFVHIKNAPAYSGKAPTQAFVLDQRGCIYEPRVAGVMVGQPVKFKNSDGILHNVHGFPKRNREFNIGMPPMVKEREQVFNKPEPVFQVKCDVHPWMNAYIAVMTHPYFAVSETDGTFEIRNVPDGTYSIEAWHEKLGTQRTEVTVSGGSAQARFSFDRPD
ncbi:MAG: carboxypeptidase regulatory-like domain-containing protein [Acidobacteriota bacterium]